MIKVRLSRGYIGCTPKQRAVLRALGLKKIATEKEFKDTPSLRGMLELVKHLVEVKENETA